MTDDDFSRALRKIRTKSEMRRSEEWANIPDRVLGLPLRPITLATFALLHGTRNAFVCGLSPTLRDVRDYILFHSPEFDPDNPSSRFLLRFRIALRTEHRLCPLSSVRHRQAIYAANLLTAIRQIREIVARTWADSLPLNEAEEPPMVAASLEAVFIDMIASEYRFWPLDTPIRHTPLARLCQMRRAAERRKLGSNAIYFDREEATVTREYLMSLNSEEIKKRSQPCAS